MAGVTSNVILNPVAEVICKDRNGATRTKYYARLTPSKEDFDKIQRLGFPVRRQGHLAGHGWTHEDSGDTSDFDEMALTIIVEFTNSVGNKFTCRYLCHKYPKKLMEKVRQPSGVRVGTIVKVERRTPDELELERIEGGFYSHKWWEDVIIRDPVQTVSPRKEEELDLMLILQNSEIMNG